MQLRIIFQEALQAGFLKHLGDVATVLLNLVCLSLFLFLHVIPDRLDDDEMIENMAVVRILLQTKISLDYYN